MNLETINYNDYLNSVPNTGNHILAQQTENEILVYQAFNPQISDFALHHQKFGGSHYSFDRMTWIKPNFLWMMYRCGWAQKQNQERVLGIWISKKGFTQILEEAVYSAYQEDIYSSKENWKTHLTKKNVRLQWDPDHDIYGNKQERKAIQLGLKNKIQREFNQEMIKEIMDLTDFVKTQYAKIKSKNLETLEVPLESLFLTDNTLINTKLKLSENKIL